MLKVVCVFVSGRVRMVRIVILLRLWLILMVICSCLVVVFLVMICSVFCVSLCSVCSRFCSSSCVWFCSSNWCCNWFRIMIVLMMIFCFSDVFVVWFVCVMGRFLKIFCCFWVVGGFCFQVMLCCKGILFRLFMVDRVFCMVLSLRQVL